MHYDDETLFAYVEGTSPIREEIEAHAAACRVCSAEIGSHRDVIEALRTAEVWDDSPDSEQAAPARPLAVTFAQRLSAEDEEGAELCEKILTGPSSWWPTRLQQAKTARTAGMVRQLLDRWRAMLERNPSNALQATAMAVDVANDLDITDYPSDFVITLRGQALRDHAFVLSFMGRLPQALELSERAERLIEQIPVPEYELARVKMVRALILRSMDRRDEALALTQRAADTYARFGDAGRHADARMTEAGILYLAGDHARALEIWRSLESHPFAPAVRVGLIHNIALCHRQLGNLVESIESFRRCVAEFELLGMDTERTRVRWSLGQALVTAGSPREAIPVLQQAWREFESLEMIADAGLVALELAEAHLLIGDTKAVTAICRELVTRFTTAGMTSRAVTALSFLREAVAMGQAKPSLIREVHSFLRELRSERPRLVAPPPPGAFED